MYLDKIALNYFVWYPVAFHLAFHLGHHKKQSVFALRHFTGITRQDIYHFPYLNPTWAHLSGIFFFFTSLVKVSFTHRTQRLKRLPAMQETWVQSLGQEDPLEKEMTPHSNTLAWRIPWTKEPGGLQSMGSQRVGHDWETSLSLSLHTQNVSLLSLWCWKTQSQIHGWTISTCVGTDGLSSCALFLLTLALTYFF